MIDSALVIDLDGTLYNSSEMDRENKLAAAHAIAEYRSISLKQAEQLLVAAHAEKSRSTSSILFAMCIPDKVIKKHQLALMHPEAYLHPDEELAASLRALKDRFRLILLTNTRRQIAIRAINALSLELYDFDYIIAGGDMAEPKPSVETLKKILIESNCDPKKSYTIGDRWVVDHEPGQKLGMHAIQVSGRDELVERLKTSL